MHLLTKTKCKKIPPILRASWHIILHIQHYFHITILRSSNITNNNIFFTVFPYTHEHMYLFKLPVNLTPFLKHKTDIY